MTTENEKAIGDLITKACEARTSDDALKFSQAACNAGNALRVLADARSSQSKLPAEIPVSSGLDLPPLFYRVGGKVDAVLDDNKPLVFSADFRNSAGLRNTSVAPHHYATCAAEGLLKLGSAPLGKLSIVVGGTTKMPRDHLRSDGFPSRSDQSLMSPAELEITSAMLAVEAAGASAALTEAVTLLGRARERVADHMESRP